MKPTVVSKEVVDRELGSLKERNDAIVRAEERSARRRPSVWLDSEYYLQLHKCPPYVSHCLEGSARRVLEAPRGVVEQKFESGLVLRTFWGRPVFCFDNSGSRRPAPEDLVYHVLFFDDRLVDHYWACDPPTMDSAKSMHLEPYGRLSANEFKPWTVVTIRNAIVTTYATDEPSFVVRRDGAHLLVGMESREVVGVKVFLGLL